MKLSRQFRFVAALVALVSVLFSQLAVAAYICPSVQMGQIAELAALSAVEADHHAMPGCDEVDMEQPVLCHAHGLAGNQSLDKPESPNLSPFVAILLVPEASDIRVAYRPATAYAVPVSLMRVLAPPLSIQNCCFRI